MYNETLEVSSVRKSTPIAQPLANAPAAIPEPAKANLMDGRLSQLRPQAAPHHHAIAVLLVFI